MGESPTYVVIFFVQKHDIYSIERGGSFAFIVFKKIFLGIPSKSECQIVLIQIRLMDGSRGWDSGPDPSP